MLFTVGPDNKNKNNNNNIIKYMYMIQGQLHIVFHAFFD